MHRFWIPKCPINPFFPEFLKWTLPSLNLARIIVPKRGLSQKSKLMVKSVDPDETVHYGLEGLRGLYTLGFICYNLFYKEDNFCDYLFSFLYTKSLLKRGLL